MINTDELEGAINTWRTHEKAEKETREILVDLCLEYLRNHTMVELEQRMQVKRTTLYYMLYGKAGKGRNGQVA